MTREEKYKSIALELLEKYIDSEITVIGEFSGDFKKSAEYLESVAKKYLKKLGCEEDKFYDIVKGRWISDYYKGGEDE